MSLRWEFHETVVMLFAQLEISQEGERRAGEMAQGVRTLEDGSLDPQHLCERRLSQYVLVTSASRRQRQETDGQLAWLKNTSSSFSGRYCLKGVTCEAM